MENKNMTNWDYKVYAGYLSSAFQGKNKRGRLEISKIAGALIYLVKNNALRLTPIYGEIEEEELELCKTHEVKLCCKLADNDSIADLVKSCIMTLNSVNVPEYVLEFVQSIIGKGFSRDELLGFFDCFVKDVSGMDSRTFFTQPNEISQLVNHLLDENIKSIYDPFGGMMDFAIAMPERHYYSCEINQDVYDLGLLRLSIAGIKDFVYRNEDCCNHRPQGRFDAIVTIPPFGVDLENMNGLFDSRIRAEEYAFKMFEQLTTNNGQLVTFVPAGFLLSPTYLNIRKELLDRNWLDKVILLPRNLFPNMTVFTAAIVLKKNMGIRHRIKMIDASSCITPSSNKRFNVLDVDTVLTLCNSGETVGQVNYVSVDEIFENDVCLAPSLYIERYAQEFTPGFCKKRVGDIIEPIAFVRNVQSLGGHFVKVRDLSTNIIDLEKHVSDFPILSEGTTEAGVITEPVILMSKRNPHRWTYCQASVDEPIFVDNSISAFRITNHSVHPGYLCMELERRMKYLLDYNLPLISTRAILNFCVEFPSIDKKRSYIEQKNIYDEAKKLFQRARIVELGLQDELEAQKKEYIAQIHSRKHAVTQNTSSLGLIWGDLMFYIQNCHGHFDPADVIGVKHQRSVGELLKSITNLIDTIDKQAYHLAEIERDWGSKEDVDIQDFILDYIDRHQSTDFDFEFQPKSEVVWGRYVSEDADCRVRFVAPDWTIKIPLDALRQVFDNIVSNAKSHGFSESNRLKNIIGLDYYYEDDAVVLEISNNGVPLSDGVDTAYIKTYGGTTRLNQTSEGEEHVHIGIGGEETDAILKQFHADYEVISTPDNEFTVTYKITFTDVSHEEQPDNYFEYDK